ncbi:tetratricopeptide repeat protein [Parabacteroides sp. OttesenSCG-928-G07]|nr:tetratricopeptide repeat protein [Parabacteroides sp. OttesenSCG-928-G07]
MKLLKYIILFIFIAISVCPVFAEDAKKDNNTELSKLSVAEQRKFDYFFYEGLNLKAAGKYDAAYDAFTHCLAIDSTASIVLYELANFHTQLNRPEKAVRMLQDAVRYNPHNFTYKLALAGMSRNIGQFGEAAAVYEELAREYPAKLELNFYLADALTQQGEIGKAIDAYDALESAMGMNENFSLAKYQLYLQLEQHENANKEIEKLAEKYPMEPRYQIRLGDIYLGDKEFDKALEYYKKAYAIDPANPYYFISMANYYEAIGNKDAAENEIKNALTNEDLDVEIKINILSRYIARMQQSRQGTDNANALFETLVEQHPEDADLKMMYGSFLLMQNKDEEAKFQFQLVAEIDPVNPTVWQQLLNLALRANDMPEVIRLCMRSIELFPDTPEFYFYLGIAFYQQGEYQRALEIYKSGISAVPENNTTIKSDFYGQIGDIYHQLDDMDSAYAAYEEALKYNERNVSVLNNYSYFLSLDKKNLSEAERMSAVTINMEPNNATYLDTYAWIFFVQGRYSLALIYIERAIRNDNTNSPELADHYGDILYMNGQKEKAVEQWKRAKELGKEGDVLERKIREESYFEE